MLSVTLAGGTPCMPPNRTMSQSAGSCPIYWGNLVLRSGSSTASSSNIFSRFIARPTTLPFNHPLPVADLTLSHTHLVYLPRPVTGFMSFPYQLSASSPYFIQFLVIPLVKDIPDSLFQISV